MKQTPEVKKILREINKRIQCFTGRMKRANLETEKGEHIFDVSAHKLDELQSLRNFITTNKTK